MLTRVYEVEYYGNISVSYLCTDPVLQWTSRELSCRNEPRKINVTIQTSAIQLLGETGLIAGIPFSYQSPYIVGSTERLVYLTELQSNSQLMRCYVFRLPNVKKATQLQDEIQFIQQGSLKCTGRNLERQEESLKLKRCHSEENISDNFLAPSQMDKSRRLSDQSTDNKPLMKKTHARRKSTPAKCREIFEVEYIGVAPSPLSHFPDIDDTVKLIQKKVDKGRQDYVKPLTGLLHLGPTEIQLLHTDHSVLRAWGITKIKACSQGTSAYFGWTCREEAREEQSCVHVFRAKDESQGITIIHSLHKVCMLAYNKYDNSNICKTCPLEIFNTTCDKLMGLTNEDDVATELSNVITSLSDEDRIEVLTKFKTPEKEVNIQNNFLIGCLRSVYERKQLNHVHNRREQPSPPTKVEIRKPQPIPRKQETSRKASSILPFFKHMKDNAMSDSESDTEIRKKTPHMIKGENRRRSSTQEGPGLVPASDRRRIRRQPSCRKAIYDSVHTSDKARESWVSHQRTSSGGSLTSIQSAVDVSQEADREHMSRWESLLNKPNHTHPHFIKEVETAVFRGVPEVLRGQVWQLLCKMKKGANHTPLIPYSQLIKADSECTNAIAMDIGRTFPSHSYFKECGGEGQERLMNILKAYSVSDSEVGYCQGMSFIAGILLVHLPDEEHTFHLFLNLLHRYELRDNYKPDLSGLKMRLYQLSRLVHDRHLAVHEHLNTYEVTPFLYAASWLMTSFATQLPFHIAARIIDFVFLQGIDAIYKVILFIIEESEKEVLALKSFDSIINYMKETIPSRLAAMFEYKIEEIFSKDISTELRDLQIEYKVLNEDISNQNKSELLEAKYVILKQQNTFHLAQIASLKKEVERCHSEIRLLKQPETSATESGSNEALIVKLVAENKKVGEENRCLRVRLAENENTILLASQCPDNVFLVNSLTGLTLQ